MKHVVRKLFINFEKEEKWLNEMAAKGLNLVDYSFGRYLFEEGKPGEYIYRIELLKEVPSHIESIAYINFMEDSGVECVSTYVRWVYFRKKAEDGAFDLYSDYASKIIHYSRVIWLVITAWLVNLMAALLNTGLGLGFGKSRGYYYNLYFSFISWGLVILLGILIISYSKTLKKLKKEKQLYE
jgi:hypothetical protein